MRCCTTLGEEKRCAARPLVLAMTASVEASYRIIMAVIGYFVNVLLNLLVNYAHGFQ